MIKLNAHCILAKLEKHIVMALKIRCSECRKKISVDEAFAGSMCRCPYCKSIVQVPAPAAAVTGGASGVRLSRPAERPGRPMAHRAKSPGGSGLEDVTGSRPIISGEHLADRKRPAGPTKIDKPGIPQIHQQKQHAVPSGDTQAGAPFRPAEKPGQPEKPTPAEAEGDALGALAGAAVRPAPEKPSPPKKLKSPPKAPAGGEKIPDTHVPAPTGGDGGVIETLPVDESKLSTEQLAAIPTANPVVFQGMVTLVLIIVLLVMASGSIFLGIKVFSKSGGDETAYEPGFEPEKIVELPNPFVVGKGTRVVCQTVAIQTPVVYCIDTGENMGDVYIYARDAVRASIRSLRADDKFGVVLVQDPQTILVGGRLYPGGPGGDDMIRRLLVSEYDEGGPDDPRVQVAGAPDVINGIKTALKQNPQTLVLLLSRNEIEHPRDLGKLVKEAKARLVLIVLGIEHDEQKKSFEEAVRAAGGNSILLLYDAIHILQDHYDQKDLPD